MNVRVLIGRFVEVWKRMGLKMTPDNSKVIVSGRGGEGERVEELVLNEIDTDEVECCMEVMSEGIVASSFCFYSNCFRGFIL